MRLSGFFDQPGAEKAKASMTFVRQVAAELEAVHEKVEKKAAELGPKSQHAKTMKKIAVLIDRTRLSISNMQTTFDPDEA